MLLDVPDPVLDVVEALLVGDVVHQHDPHGSSVVGGGNGSESLLPRSVPDLQLDLLPIQLYCANLEVNSCKELLSAKNCVTETCVFYLYKSKENRPIVDMKVALKASSEKRKRTQVFPTPESPISNSLNR